MSKEISDEEKARQADRAFQNFFDSLGPNDTYKRLIIEVLLEEIYGKPVDLSKDIKWD